MHILTKCQDLKFGMQLATVIKNNTSEAIKTSWSAGSELSSMEGVVM
jgi:hypothetical protein